MKLKLQITGILAILGTLMLFIGMSGLMDLFNWPDILSESPHVILQNYHDLYDTIPIYWFLTGFSAIIMIIPLLLFNDVLGKKLSLNRSTAILGTLGGLLSGMGFLRWVFAVAPLARQYPEWSAQGNGKALEAAFMAMNAFGGAEIGEFLGQFFLGLWMFLLCLNLFTSKRMPRWFTLWGMLSGLCFSLSSAEVLNEASIPWFPYWGGFMSLGYLAFIWLGCWGIMLLLPPIQQRLLQDNGNGSRGKIK